MIRLKNSLKCQIRMIFKAISSTSPKKLQGTRPKESHGYVFTMIFMLLNLIFESYNFNLCGYFKFQQFINGFKYRY